jgi:hypothetical protein
MRAPQRAGLRLAGARPALAWPLVIVVNIAGCIGWPKAAAAAATVATASSPLALPSPPPDGSRPGPRGPRPPPPMAAVQGF